MKNIVIGLTLLSLAGCASVTRGTKNDVVIDVEPRNATITTSLDDQCTANPCTLKVKRKEEFTVTAKAEGFVEETVSVKTKVAKSGVAATAGNALAGGVIGVAVDSATGALLTHSPNPVIIKLKPVETEPSQSDETNNQVPTS